MKRKVDIDKLLEQVLDYRIEYWDGGILQNTDDIIARGDARAFTKMDDAWMRCHADRLDNVTSMVLRSSVAELAEYKIERVW